MAEVGRLNEVMRTIMRGRPVMPMDLEGFNLNDLIQVICTLSTQLSYIQREFDEHRLYGPK